MHFSFPLSKPSVGVSVIPSLTRYLSGLLSELGGFLNTLLFCVVHRICQVRVSTERLTEVHEQDTFEWLRITAWVRYLDNAEPVSSRRAVSSAFFASSTSTQFISLLFLSLGVYLLSNR